MPALESLPGKVGPYRVVEKVGEGGMGVVYLARDVRGREVALKVLGPALVGDPSARARLSREVETMRRVRSPFVAEVLDADTDGRAPYVVTRFVPGQTLDEAVRQDGPLHGVALQRFATGLARALVEIHAAGVVHRDLKPGNVMLSGGDPVVIDFGIAHVADATKLTQTGIVMGTPGYLAPEVITGEPSSPASDVHSWGATVAFAATGQAPFGTGTFQTIFFRVLNGQADLAGMPGALLPLRGDGPVAEPRATAPRRSCWPVQCARADMNAPATATITMPGSASAWTPGGTLVESPGATAAGAMPGAGRESRRRGTAGARARSAGLAARAGRAAASRRGGWRRRSSAAGGLRAPPGERPGATAAATPGKPPAQGTRAGRPRDRGRRRRAEHRPPGRRDGAGAGRHHAATRRRQGRRRPRGPALGTRGPADRHPRRAASPRPGRCVRALLTTVVLAPLAVVIAALAAAASVLIGHTTSLPRRGQLGGRGRGRVVRRRAGSRGPRDQLRRSAQECCAAALPW